MVLPHIFAFVDFLRSCQVTEIQPCFFEHSFGIRVRRLEKDLEDGVRPTTLSVHGSLPDESVLLTSLHQLQTIQIMRDCILCEPFYENAVHFGLVEIEGFRFRKILHHKNST